VTPSSYTVDAPTPAARESGRQESLLSVQNVGKRFGEIVALREVNMEVEQRDVFGIAGPNGAGKTTLFNVVAGAFAGTGRVMFEGADIMGLKPHQVAHRGIARTFQVPVLFASMTVEENVLVGAHFGGRWGKREHEVVTECLNCVGLSKKAQTAARHVDLLDKKLTMLAAALATNPSLLLLDEPMGGLAPAEIALFGDLIRGLNEERGMTLIVIEHLIRKLVELSNKLMILDHGNEIRIGPPREVVADPRVIELYLGTDEYA
jgi:branched-chain amino acid transport system ATP-binding protein